MPKFCFIFTLIILKLSKTPFYVLWSMPLYTLNVSWYLAPCIDDVCISLQTSLKILSPRCILTLGLDLGLKDFFCCLPSNHGSHKKFLCFSYLFLLANSFSPFYYTYCSVLKTQNLCFHNPKKDKSKECL